MRACAALVASSFGSVERLPAVPLMLGGHGLMRRPARLEIVGSYTWWQGQCHRASLFVNAQHTRLGSSAAIVAAQWFAVLFVALAPGLCPLDRVRLWLSRLASRVAMYSCTPSNQCVQRLARIGKRCALINILL